jgi:hypothetical protein
MKVLCLIWAMLVLGASAAVADFVPLGPVDNSWGVSGYEDGYWSTYVNGPRLPGLYDMLVLEIKTSGVTFETPGIRFDDPSWTYWENGTRASVHGTERAPGNIGISFVFNSPPPANAEIWYAAFLGGVQRGVVQKLFFTNGSFVGDGYIDQALDPNDFLPLAVPAPAAALLGVIGLGLVGWVKRRLS